MGEIKKGVKKFWDGETPRMRKLKEGLEHNCKLLALEEKTRRFKDIGINFHWGVLS